MAKHCSPCTIGRILLAVGYILLSPDGALSAPCTTTSSVQFTVESSEEANSAAEIVNCDGGTFSIQWVGNIVVPTVFNVSGGTTLSVFGGSSEEDIMNGSLATQLFTVSDNGNLNLEGLTLTNASSSSDDGGAVYATGSTVTVTDCIFTGNVAEKDGGAVYLSESHLEIHGVTIFSYNVAGDDGGAICAESNSTIEVLGEAYWQYNDATRSDDSAGGAMDLSSSSRLSILGKAFLWRNVADFGGAIYWRGDSFLNITGEGEVEFSENEAFIGGAIAGRSDSDEEPFVIMSLAGRGLFFNNTARTSGGAMGVLFAGSVDITGEVTFLQNHSDGDGGAVSVAAAGDFTISDNATVTFEKNTCDGSGGGIVMWGSDGLVIDGEATAAFVGNTAGDGGGAIYVTAMRAVTFDARGSLSFTENHASNLGGAVRLFGVDSLEISDLEFDSNTARIGGAMVVESSRLGSSSFEANLNSNPGEVHDCYFSNNTAVEDGGALHVGSGSLDVRGSTFLGNTAGRSGGAMSVAGQLTFFENCTFEMNAAPSGPALVNVGSIDLDSEAMVYSSNELMCPDGQFVDYVDLDDDEAFNTTEARYLVYCEGCGAWELCEDCTLAGDTRVPICAGLLDHSTSPAATGTLEELELESGYWRATNTSKTILSCYNEDACVGGTTVTEYCSKGYEGPYCAVCEDGYAPGLSFSCSSCSNEGHLILRVFVAAVIVVLIAAVCVAVLVDLTTVRAAPERSNCCAAGFRRLKAGVRFQSLKIAVVSWQIITQVSDISNVVYPESYERFLSVVGLFNFDLAGFLASACLFETDFYDKLLISTLGPIAALAVLACTYAIAIKRNGGSIRGGSNPADHEAVIRKKHASMAILVPFLVYGSVSGTVFGMFACEDLDDEGSYLRGDYSIRCDTDRHRLYQGYAAFMIFIYPVGIPVLFGAVLLSYRAALRDHSRGGGDESTIKILADLWEPYRPEMYLFELVEYLRRILLTGIVVFIFPNTAAQIAVTFVVEFFFFVVSVVLLPYQKRSDTWLSHAGHVVVLVTFYLALLFRVDISDERDISQEIFAGVLVLVHVLMILSVIMEAVIVMFQQVKETGTSASAGSSRP